VRIRLAAPASEGRANQELVRFLAAALQVTRRDVEVLAGATARRKLVRVGGVTAGLARTRLGL